MKGLTVVLTGGGTGGHVYPNIAIYEKISEKYPDTKFLYLGTKSGEENKIIRALNGPIEFIPVRSKGIPARIRSFGTFLSMIQILLGMIKSFFVLKKFKPDIVIGTGGYVAAPVLLAASLLKIKIFIHEQNSIPGRLNTFISRFATKIGVTFESTINFFPKDKTIHTGYPLRRFINKNRGEGVKEKLNIPENNKVVFIFGGSKGARTINRAIAGLMPKLLEIKDLSVILSTGRGLSKEYSAYEETVKDLRRLNIPFENSNRLIVREYFDNIDEIYSISDFVISRAGAGTIEELTGVGMPSILIPKIDLPGDHQILNAKEQEKRGGAFLIYENIRVIDGNKEIYIPVDELFEKILKLAEDSEIAAQMKKNLGKIERKDSTGIILSEVEKLCGIDNSIKVSEFKVFYLFEPSNEKNYELVFDNTTFGNSILCDYYIHGLKSNVLFEIRINGKNREKLILRLLKGDLKVNGISIKESVEINDGDKIEIEEKILKINFFTESFKYYEEKKGIRSKMIGSSLGIMISRVGGFFREVVVTALFGAKNISDLYVAGLTVSNFMRRIVAENAMENAFLPIFMRFFHRSSRKKMWEASSSIINFTLFLSALFTVFGIIFADKIIGVIYFGFRNKGIFNDAVNITRLMFPYLFLVTISAVMATFLKAFNRFGIAEISSIFFSIGSIVGIVSLYSISNIYALGIGILFGGILQILFLLPFAIGVLKKKELEFNYTPGIKLNSPANKKYYSQLAPITGDTLLSKTAEVVDQFLASGLKPGSISFLYFAKTIFRLPFAVISQSINSVILRDYSNNIALFDKEKAKKLFIEGSKINIFILAPVSIAMFLMAKPIVTLLYGRGEFGTTAIHNSSIALQFYSIGLIGWGLHSLTTRIFSARIDIKTSMYLNLFMLALNVALSFILVSTELKFAGLALASSISFSLFAIIRIIVLKIKLNAEDITIKLKEIYYPFVKTISASFFMIIIMLQMRYIFSNIKTDSVHLKSIIEITSITFIGLSVYFIASLLMKNTEIMIFRKKVFKKIPGKPVSMLSPFRFLEKVSSDPEKYRDEFLYKINLYLNSPNWEIRNVGIKLTGVFYDKSKAKYLLNLLNSKNSNPFIRRNCLTSLRKIGKWNDEIKETILKKLNDPYFEVRVEAINFLSEKISSDDFEIFRNSFTKKLQNSSTEEICAWLSLIAKAGSVEDMKLLKKFYLSSNSLIRESLLKLMINFHKRGLIDLKSLRAEAEKVLLTSNNMQPTFRLKTLVNNIFNEGE